MATDKKSVAGIVGIAKRNRIDVTKPILFQSGHYVMINAVSANLIEESRMMIKDPPVPVFINEDKGREEPNPNDPEYVARLAEAEARRNIAATEAMIMFGVRLCDEEGNLIDPPDNGWESRLHFMAKRGYIDIGDFDFDDEIDREFLYKKYFVVSAPDIMTLARVTQLDEEAVAQAQATFQNNS